MTPPTSPHSPRPTRVASYALHFQIPILPTPTPPSLLKRRSTSSPTSSLSLNNQSTRATPVSTSSLPAAVSPTSPRATSNKSAEVRAPSHRRSDSCPSSLTSSPVLPAVDMNRPPLIRRDTPRPGQRSRTLSVDEFDAEFGLCIQVRD